MTAYLFDSNVFIQAKNLHYGFDFCPAFWDCLVEQNGTGKVASIDKVVDELQAGDDELAEWAAAWGEELFLPPDDAVLPALRTVSDWASGRGYRPAAVATFLQVADYWLVAHALAHGCIVVTHEVPADTASKIKIPNACIGLGLRCMSPYEMLRRARAICPGNGQGLMARFTESEVEDAALEWLAALAYAVLHGPDIGPEGPAPERCSYDEVLLTGRLRDGSLDSILTCLPRRWRRCCARYGRRKLPPSRRTAACTVTWSKACPLRLPGRMESWAAMPPG